MEESLSAEVKRADDRLAVDFGDQKMPLDITIRSMALAIAQRHCGDTTIKEGNLYQQLKMDNKLSGPLTVNHVIHAALVFERYLWGEWSKGIAGEAMEASLAEMDAAVKKHYRPGDPEERAAVDELDATIKAGVEKRVADDDQPDVVHDDPIRPHSGGSE